MSRKRTFTVGDRLPLSLSREELAEIVGLSLSRFDDVRRSDSHPAIKELLPRTGHPRFDGATAQRWIDQQLETPRKFFRGADRKKNGRAVNTPGRVEQHAKA